MSNEKDYTAMSADELKDELLRLNDLLEEIIDEREIMLGQSGQHIPATSYVKKYKKEIEATKAKIEIVEELIRKK